MSALIVGPFSGLDLRRSAGAADSMSFRAAQNVTLEPDGSVGARGAWRVVVDLTGQYTAGLYTTGGLLRTVGWDPDGAGPIVAAPILIPSNPPIQVDRIAGTATPELVTAFPYDGDAAFGVYPYIVVKRGAYYEHHWVRPAIAATQISLPFQPGAAAIKMASKVWASDSQGGAVRFSSTLNGPTDWTEQSDAGFLPVVKHATGDRTVNGFGFYNNLLAVLFDDSTQLWSVDPDPALHSLSRILHGAGTPYSRTAVNVRGNLMYLSQSGFADLYTQTMTGEIRSNQIGSRIQPLTDVLDVASTVPVSLWWGAKSLYLGAVGAQIFVYTKYAQPINKNDGGWTAWTAPAAVSAMCELNGQLYIRCGDVVYTHDEAALEQGTLFDLRTQFLDGKSPGQLKEWMTVDASQRGSARSHLYPLSSYPDDFEPGPDFLAGGDTRGDIPICMSSEVFSMGFTGAVGGGANRWRLDRMLLRYSSIKG